MNKQTKAAFLSGLLLVSSLSCLAQTSTSRITGKVSDATGAALNGAVVSIRNQETNEERTTTTSGNGSFAIVSLPPSTFTVTVSETGFGSRKIDSLKLQLGQEFVWNPSLSVSSADSLVDVTAETVNLDTSSARIGGNVPEREVQQPSGLAALPPHPRRH